MRLTWKKIQSLEEWLFGGDFCGSNLHSFWFNSLFKCPCTLHKCKQYVTTYIHRKAKPTHVGIKAQVLGNPCLLVRANLFIWLPPMDNNLTVAHNEMKRSHPALPEYSHQSHVAIIFELITIKVTTQSLSCTSHLSIAVVRCDVAGAILDGTDYRTSPALQILLHSGGLEWSSDLVFLTRLF